jgi:uncharacterized protein YyaL (SSP411 family)
LFLAHSAVEEPTLPPTLAAEGSRTLVRNDDKALTEHAGATCGGRTSSKKSPDDLAWMELANEMEKSVADESTADGDDTHLYVESTDSDGPFLNDAGSGDDAHW